VSYSETLEEAFGSRRIVKSTGSVVLQQMGSQTSDSLGASQSVLLNKTSSTGIKPDSQTLIQANQPPRQSEPYRPNRTQQSNQPWREATFVLGAIGVIFIVGVFLRRQELSNSPEKVITIILQYW